MRRIEHFSKWPAEFAYASRFVLRAAVALDLPAAVHCDGGRVQVEPDGEHREPDGVPADICAGQGK